MSAGSERPALSVFGLGYVGCVSAASFASRGHTVIGFDIDPVKTGFLRRGRSPLVEKGVGDLVADAVAAGNLRIGESVREAVLETDMSIVCVGTPSGFGGGLSTRYLERVSEEIGTALADADRRHIVVFRSTMVPGTCRNLLIPLLERTSGKRAGIDFGVCVNPEYLREGSSIDDFLDPPKTVVGQSDAISGAQVMDLFDGLPGPRFCVPLGVAEMSKYVDNSFHALKVAFGNEIGAICSSLGLDSHRVMDVFLSDTKLNISPSYLRPGFAFGGSCLPKDVRALVHTARIQDVEVPILGNIMVSNEARLRRAVEAVLDTGRRRVGIFGLSFKSGTDDLRESPMVELAERLLGKGCDVAIYDANVALSRLIGTNREYIDDRLPHIGRLLSDDADAVVARSDVIVVGVRDEEVVRIVENASLDKVILDLVRVPGAENLRSHSNYVGIAW